VLRGLVHGGTLDLWQDLGVGVHPQSDQALPEHLHDRSRRRPRDEQERCAGVPKIVEPQPVEVRTAPPAPHHRVSCGSGRGCARRSLPKDRRPSSPRADGGSPSGSAWRAHLARRRTDVAEPVKSSETFSWSGVL
jgi:hypothetical protein